VDDVLRATEPLPTRRFSDVIGDVLALGGDGEQRVVNHGPTHALLGADHRGFERPSRIRSVTAWNSCRKALPAGTFQFDTVTRKMFE
jgi:hypothetical protein